MREALAAIRTDLGADAVMLSSRKLATGVEVIAAIDYDDSLFDAAGTGPTASFTAGFPGADGGVVFEEQDMEEHVAVLVVDRVEAHGGGDTVDRKEIDDVRLAPPPHRVVARVSGRCAADGDNDAAVREVRHRFVADEDRWRRERLTELPASDEGDAPAAPEPSGLDDPAVLGGPERGRLLARASTL